jgi:uncharacterized membrane protein YjgN (DUF898 family)
MRLTTHPVHLLLLIVLFTPELRYQAIHTVHYAFAIAFVTIAVFIVVVVVIIIVQVLAVYIRNGLISWR